MRMPIINLPESGIIDNRLVSRMHCERAFLEEGLHGVRNLFDSGRGISLLARDFLMQREIDDMFFG